MPVSDLLPFGRTSVPVTKGANPILTFQDEMNKLFSEFFGEMSFPRWGRLAEAEPSFAVSPAMDVAENDKEFRVSAELPGMEPKDVQITAAEGYLTIKGEK